MGIIKTVLLTSLAIVIISSMVILLSWLKINPSPDWTLSIVNAVATTVLVIITALQINEASKSRTEERKVHIESAKPTLSLEPSNYSDERHFTCVTLVNSGMVAKNVEIDVKYKENIDLLYISSIGTSQRVPLLNGHFPDNGGAVTVQVKYCDTYDNPYSEKLSIDFDSINLAKRRFTYVSSDPEYLGLNIAAVAQKLAELNSRISSETIAVGKIAGNLEDVKEELQKRRDSSVSY